MVLKTAFVVLKVNPILPLQSSVSSCLYRNFKCTGDTRQSSAANVTQAVASTRHGACGGHAQSGILQAHPAAPEGLLHGLGRAQGASLHARTFFQKKRPYHTRSEMNSNEKMFKLPKLEIGF